MNFNFAKIKEKIDKLGKKEEKVNNISKEKELVKGKKELSENGKKSEQKNIKKDDRKTKESASETIKRYMSGYLSKDKSAKRVMKQSEKGILMIISAIIAGYIAYSFLYQPALSESKVVEEAYIKTEDRRLDILTQLDNQSSLVSSIKFYENKLNEYKLMYPNYRTENEILKVIELMLAKEQVTPATFVKGVTKTVQKSTIGSFITNKGIESQIEASSYFAAGTQTAEKQPDTTTSETVEVNEEDASNFGYTEVSFTVSDISKEHGLRIMNTFATFERVMIPESWKLTGGSDGNYQLEATVLFFSYRDSDKFEALFN